MSAHRSIRANWRRHLRGVELLEQRRLLTTVVFDQIAPNLEVADINTETLGLDPRDLTIAGNLLFFTGDDGIHGRELWKTDLLGGATALVEDILVGADSAFTLNAFFETTAVLSNTLFFVAEDALGDVALWKSDGTSAGTVFVKQLPGRPSEMLEVNNKLFLSIGTELWASDGTTSGTTLLADVVQTPEYLTKMGNTLFFSAIPALWKSDGSVGGTELIKEVEVENLTNINGTLYFAGDDDSGHGSELWKSDGTTAGTIEVKDIAPGMATVGPSGPRSTNPSDFTYVDGTIYFTIDTISLFGIYPGCPFTCPNVWQTDGTEAGTVAVIDEFGDDIFAFNDQLYIVRGDAIKEVGGPFITPWMSLIRNLTFADDAFYFTALTEAEGDELWRSDGTAAGTELVADIISGAGWGVVYEQPVAVGTSLFFVADDGMAGPELWKTDPLVGTEMVYDCDIGSSSDPHHLTVVGNDLYFTADDGVTPSSQLWAAGTVAANLLLGLPQPQKLYDDPSYPSSNSEDLINLIDIGGELVFTHYFTYLWASANWQHEFELWKSDGTTAGTELLDSSYFSFFPEMLPHHGPLYQAVQGGNLYFELGSFTGDWAQLGTGRYDGSSVEELMLTGLTEPSQYTAVDGSLFFSAVSPGYGRELWVTTDGFDTYQHLSDTGDILRPRLILDPNFSEFVAFDDQLFFTAGVDSRMNGYYTESYVSELWKSDGTVAGTTQIVAVGGDSHIENLTVVDDKLFFTTASQPALWVSDGTTGGTEMLKQFEQIGGDFGDANLDVLCEWAGCPQPQRIDAEMAELNGMVYFAGDTGDGVELWRSDGTVAGTELVADILPGQGGSNPASFVAAGNWLFFAANDGVHGRELWTSNGTPGGTTLVADVLGGSFSSNPDELTIIDDSLYFAAQDAVHGRELWRTDISGFTKPTVQIMGNGWAVDAYALDEGQNPVVPFSNLDTAQVVFDSPQTTAPTLTLLGPTNGAPPISTTLVGWTSGGQVATFTFSTLDDGFYQISTEGMTYDFGVLHGNSNGDTEVGPSVVNIFDYLILSGAFNTSVGTTPSFADFNGDSIVDIFDYLILNNSWADDLSGFTPMPPPLSTFSSEFALAALAIDRVFGDESEEPRE